MRENSLSKLVRERLEENGKIFATELREIIEPAGKYTISKNSPVQVSRIRASMGIAKPHGIARKNDSGCDEVSRRQVIEAIKIASMRIQNCPVAMLEGNGNSICRKPELTGIC